MINIHRLVAAGVAASMFVGLGVAQGMRVRDRERTVRLKSTNYKRSSKRVENRGVRLIRRRSNAPCVYGRSWGYNRNTIWVSRGCEADFAYVPRRR